MAPIIDQHREALARLCRKFHVRRLDVFGSVVTDRFDPEASDIDLLVEFSPSSEMNAADQYFGLLFALEELFGRKVDLVCADAMRNPYFVQRVNQTKRPLYAA